MDPTLSDRVNEVTKSATMAVMSRAKEMKRNGIDVIDLSAGEPDFPTPHYIKASGVQAIEDDKTKYTPPAGLEELRECVALKLKKENGLEYSSEDIIITAGAKQAVFNAAFCLFQEGHEVVIPSPFWVSYPEIVKLAGAEPVIVRGEPDNDFKISVENLERHATRKTRGMILNSPTNPSGAVYTPEELSAIGRFCAEHGMWIVSDEIYEKIVYDDETVVSIARACPEVKDRTVVVNGLSKTMCMTGWRIGYAASKRELIEAMIRLQSHTTSCVSAISQYAALTALRAPDEYDKALNEMVSEFDKRRRYIVESLQEKYSLKMVYPKGAFYLFFDVSPFFGKECDGIKVNSSISMCNFLLEKARVALVPGKSFGEDGYVRLSYTASVDELEEAALRIKDALKKLQ